MKNTKNLPKKPGYYWARSDKYYEWYNMVVDVYGTSPYYRIQGWKIGVEKDFGNMILEDIADFGPEIKRPNVPKEIVEK